MRANPILLHLLFAVLIPPLAHGQTPVNQDEKKHLFILSGQSNMAGLQPNESFTPAVAKEFGSERVIVVKDAHGGQPIRRWHKNWRPEKGDEPKATGDLYDRLMKKVTDATRDKKIDSVTFLWMQGEKDAREKHGNVYEASLKGLYAQLSDDLKRNDVNLVIGRLSDFDLENKRYPHWTKVREALVRVADSSPHFDWVNTDDLNDGLNRKGNEIKNDLHYSADGYKVFGERLADKAIALIKNRANPGHRQDLPTTGDKTASKSIKEWQPSDFAKPVIDTEPDDHNDGIPVGTLAATGCDQDSIMKLVEQIGDGKYKNIDSLLIAHRGKLVLECYFRQARPDVPHYQMSITKSITALVLGRAMQMGYIKDLHRPVVSYLSQVNPSQLAPGAAKVTVAECLNMHSGLRIPQDKSKTMRRQPAKVKGQGHAQWILANSDSISSETRNYKYQSSDPVLIMQVVDAAVPESSQKFIEDEVFGKLGITNYRWQADLSGLPKAAAGASLCSRDMLKLGMLISQKGKWNGQQLCSEEFIATAVSPIYTNKAGNTYGYFWWGSEMRAGGETHRVISARGAGGQFILVVPSAHLIVVATSDNKGPDMRFPIKEFAPRHILPAFVRN